MQKVFRVDCDKKILVDVNLFAETVVQVFRLECIGVEMKAILKEIFALFQHLLNLIPNAEVHN
jgi:hypothetical protein